MNQNAPHLCVIHDIGRKKLPLSSHRPEVWGQCCTNRKLVKLSLMWNQAVTHTWTLRVTTKSYVLARALRTRTTPNLQKEQEKASQFPRTDRRHIRSNFYRERTTLCDLPTTVWHLKHGKESTVWPQLSFIWHLTHRSQPSCYLLIVYQWQAPYKLGLHTSKVKMHSGHRQRITEKLTDKSEFITNKWLNCLTCVRLIKVTGLLTLGFTDRINRQANAKKLEARRVSWFGSEFSWNNENRKSEDSMARRW